MHLVMRLATGSAMLAAGLALACGSEELMAPEDTAVASVEVAPAAVTLVSFGESKQFSATARNAGGTAVAAIFTWASSDLSIATVNTSGSVIAVADGVSSITATAAGIESNPVTVTVAQALAVIEVTPADETLITLGDAAVFAATGTDALGNAMEGFVWEWSSSDETVATVDVDGNATAQGVGSTSITATNAGVSGSGQLVVAPVPVGRLDMPDSVDVGGQVSVDVQLLTAGYGSVTGAVAFTVSFDPSALQYSADAAAGYVALVSDNTAGTIKMVASEPMGFEDDFTAATIVFDVVGGAEGPSELDVSIDALIEALIFVDFTADGVGQTRSLFIE